MNVAGRRRSRRWAVLGGALLPLAVLVLLPLLLTRVDRHLAVIPLGFFRWVGVVPICLGAALGIWSAALLVTRGEGTPAPWAPPHRFVLAGPYRVVRNPMMLGAFTVLCGEAMLAASLLLFLYLGLVIGVAGWYVLAIEEKGLERRFGDAYLVYKERVPRWLPRLFRSPYPR